MTEALTAEARILYFSWSCELGPKTLFKVMFVHYAPSDQSLSDNRYIDIGIQLPKLSPSCVQVAELIWYDDISFN